jgi:hypothetical protein
MTARREKMLDMLVEVRQSIRDTFEPHITDVGKTDCQIMAEALGRVAADLDTVAALMQIDLGGQSDVEWLEKPGRSEFDARY